MTRGRQGGGNAFQSRAESLAKSGGSQRGWNREAETARGMLGRDRESRLGPAHAGTQGHAEGLRSQGTMLTNRVTAPFSGCCDAAFLILPP